MVTPTKYFKQTEAGMVPSTKEADDAAIAGAKAAAKAEIEWLAREDR